MKFTTRLAGISASSTMAVMQEAQMLRQQGIDVIDFGPGEPDFPTPGPIKDAGIQAISQDFTKYTAAAGMPDLRSAVAAKYNREWGTDFSAGNVVITCGAKHAIFNVCFALFQEGDEVLLPAPYWVTFPEVVKIAGAAVRFVPTRQEDDFVLLKESVEAAIGPRTRGLIINSPNNPTGAVIPEATIRDLMALCRRENIFLLSDETYEYFVYDSHLHSSLASALTPDDTSFAIVGSVSKTYSMTGWRIGYCVGHPKLIDKIAEFQSHQTGNPTSISQKAAMAALASDAGLVQAMKSEYERRRALVLNALSEIPGFQCAVPNGAFYAFPDVSEALAATGIANSQEFSRFLLQEARVATVPGSAFGMEGCIRISYATSIENLKEGLSRIRVAVEAATSRPIRS